MRRILSISLGSRFCLHDFSLRCANTGLDSGAASEMGFSAAHSWIGSFPPSFHSPLTLFAALHRTSGSLIWLATTWLCSLASAICRASVPFCCRCTSCSSAGISCLSRDCWEEMYLSASSYAGSTPGSIGGFHVDGDDDDADEEGPDVESGANDTTDERRTDAAARRQSRLVAQLAILVGAEGEEGCVRERKLRRMSLCRCTPRDSAPPAQAAGKPGVQRGQV